MRYLYLLCLPLLALCLPAQTPTSPPESTIETGLQMEIPLSQSDLTITESARLEANLEQGIGANYDFGKIADSLSETLKNDQASHSASSRNDARTHLRDVLIGFILEIIITIIVLQIAFSICGFPCLFYQIALLGLAVALAGATLEYFLFIGLFNPIRLGLSFIILLLLIQRLTDVREWATTIRIALLARIISLAVMWLAFAGIMMTFGL